MKKRLEEGPGKANSRCLDDGFQQRIRASISFEPQFPAWLLAKLLAKKLCGPFPLE